MNPSCRRPVVFTLGLLAVAACGWILLPSSEAAGEKKKRRRQAEQEAQPAGPGPALPVLKGAPLPTDEDSYDGQPAVAVAPDGAAWTAWVRYGQGADGIVACPQGGKPQAVTDAPGQYVRPVLAASGESLWCFWTRTEPEALSTVWFSRRSGGSWSKPGRLLPEEPRAHQNPEAAAGPDGKVAVVCQVHNGTDYDIHLSLWDGKAWQPSRALSGPETSDWDPTAVFDSRGGLHVAWSAFKDGDYDVTWLSPASDALPRRISARGEYDLHPWLAAGPDGKVWASWDAVRVPRHGFSGTSTITGANLKGDEDETHGKQGARAFVEVRVLDAGKVFVPGKPREEITAPEGALIAHCALAKVVVGPKGEPWVFYRTLKRLPRKDYHWDLVARPFREGAWGDPSILSDSDGYLEEAGLAASPSGLLVVYGGEHRAARSARKPGGMFPEPVPAGKAGEGGDHHHDFDSHLGWKGDVYLASVEAGGAPAPDALVEEKAPADQPVDARLSRAAGRREVQRGGKAWQLLWGDLHRHSNVSRCSQGREPAPDDLYHYGTDICLYDFFGLSDHAEHPAPGQENVIDWYWWKQQKTADLYHVPGFMSVLYDLEWSMTFPDGHHNTIFASRPTLRLTRSIAATSTLQGGWDALAKHGLKAITIPHTGADPRMGTDWSVQDDRYRRLCEIFQACRGSYEHGGCPREFRETSNKKGFYWNALEKGIHVGVIASTDHGYGVAYACVYAQENTREAVWQALWDRRCYGSTTYGLQLDVHSGEHWMGEAWTQKGAPVLEVAVKGAKPIRSVEILGRSKVLHAEGSAGKPLNQAEVHLTWTDPDWAAQDQEQWYYVRVIQVDDEMAWSSPVWVTPARD